MPYPSVTYSFTDGTNNIIYAAQVNQNFTDVINGVSNGTKDIQCNNLQANGNLVAYGNTTLGNSNSDTLTISGPIVLNSTVEIKVPVLTLGDGNADVVSISGDVFSPHRSYCTAVSESGTSDNISSINPSNLNAHLGTVLVINPTSGHTITIKHNQGLGYPIMCTGGADKVLSSQYDTAMLIFHSSSDHWDMIAYSHNA